VTFEVLLKNGIFYFSEKEAGAGEGGGGEAERKDGEQYSNEARRTSNVPILLFRQL